MSSNINVEIQRRGSKSLSESALTHSFKMTFFLVVMNARVQHLAAVIIVVAAVVVVHVDVVAAVEPLAVVAEMT